MKVRAIDVGFYNGTLQAAGSVFEVKDGQKGKWFEPVAEDAPEGDKIEKKRGRKTRPDYEPQTMSEIAAIDAEQYSTPE
jgi:hypothetical protein